MKIVYVTNPDPGAQDMLTDSLLYGLVRLCGQENVHEYWGHLRYCSQSNYLLGWPVYLGALTYNTSPPKRRGSLDEYDLVFIATSALDSVDLCGVNPDRLVLVNGSDVPGGEPPLAGCLMRTLMSRLTRVRLVLHRSGCAW